MLCNNRTVQHASYSHNMSGGASGAASLSLQPMFYLCSDRFWIVLYFTSWMKWTTRQHCLFTDSQHMSKTAFPPSIPVAVVDITFRAKDRMELWRHEAAVGFQSLHLGPQHRGLTLWRTLTTTPRERDPSSSRHRCRHNHADCGHRGRGRSTICR